MKRFESLLEKLGSYYCENLTPKKSGMFFRMQKCGNYFLHTECNGKLISKLGLTQEDIVGKNLYDFLPHEIVAYKRKYYQAAWEGDSTVYKNSMNGTNYLVYLIPVFSNGSVVEVIGYGIDISKWDLHNGIVSITDLNGVIKFVSENALKTYGLCTDELTDLKLDICPDDIDSYKKIRREIIETKKARHMKMRIRSNGIKLCLLSIGMPILHNGNVICLISFSEIISQSKIC